MAGQKIIEGLRDAVRGNFERVTIDGQVWVRQQPKVPRTLLDGHMSRNQVAAALEQLVFTAAKEWRRTIMIEAPTRDLLVKALRYLAVP